VPHATPRNGDIVIACVDAAWTMKYFFNTGNKYHAVCEASIQETE